MVQSSDRIRRWWAVPGSRVRAAGTRWERQEEGAISREKAVDPLSTIPGERVLAGVQGATDLLCDPEYKPALLSVSSSSAKRNSLPSLHQDAGVLTDGYMVTG